MSVNTRAATADARGLDLEDLWEKVQDAQKRSTGGFLRKEDVKRGLTAFREHIGRHPSFTVRVEPTVDYDSLTILVLRKTGVEVRRSDQRWLGGIKIEFDFLADEDRQLFEALKEEGFGGRSKRKRLGADVGSNEPLEGTVVAEDVDLSDEPTEETLKSLFKINKHARKYADKAHRHYQRGKHYSAKRNSAKKEALYGAKAEVLSDLKGEADRVERHRIDGQLYNCLYFGEWSFHCKPDEISLRSDRFDEEPETLTDFEKDADTGSVTRSLKSSLVHLNDTFGADANEHLPRKRVGDYFIGWKHLG